MTKKLGAFLKLGIAVSESKLASFILLPKM